jgi:hypothetical protein
MNSHFLRIAFVSIAAVTLIAPLTAQERGRGVLGPAQRSGRGVLVDDGSPRPQAFSISLVLGDMQTATAADNVPAAARKALTDVKDFLPYKAYRLLDSQWTLCCGRPSMVSSPIVSRLRGPEDQDYGVEIVPSSAGNGKYYVHFSLWEPRTVETTVSAAGGRGAMTSLDAQRAEETTRREQNLQFLRAQLEEMRRAHAENHPDVAALKTKIEELERSLNEMRRPDSMRRTLTASASRRPIIDTSFTMDVGETVVVGTSRLKGDKALIALLTAVAPTKSTTK